MRKTLDRARAVRSGGGRRWSWLNTRLALLAHRRSYSTTSRICETSLSGIAATFARFG